LDSDGGILTTAKAPSTPSEPEHGVVDVLEVAAEQLNISTSDLLARTTLFVHGSTVATNAILERRGAKSALITSAGHEDTFIVGRMSQKTAGLSLSQLSDDRQLTRPSPPLVSKAWIVGAHERIDRDGHVVVPLDQQDLTQKLARIVADGVESIAVCFLWSPVNRQHEVSVRELLAAVAPGTYVVLSSDVAPLLGEYERTVTTVLSAYLGPRIHSYLGSLGPTLEKLGLRCGILLVQATGGLTTPAGIISNPLNFLDSGPVAGVLGGRHFCGELGAPDAILADMGGTSFDVAVIKNYRVHIDDAPVSEKYRYFVPKVDVRSVGSGGGSKIWIDPQGGLRVGPQSAGSQPGPVCYGRGGTEPTVTDANLVLGLLDAEYFLGGRHRLDLPSALDALTGIGKRVGLDAISTAAGAFRVVNAQMADLIRSSTVERGYDPRGFSLMSYGGAGSTHAAYMARELRISRVIIPRHASVFCALGMLSTDLQHTSQKSIVMSLPATEVARKQLNQSIRDLEVSVLQQFSSEGVEERAVELERVVHLKYTMQVHELAVECPASELIPAGEEKLIADFEAEYERTYGIGTGYRAAGIQITRCRVTGRSPVPRPRLQGKAPAESRSPQPSGLRKAYLPEGQDNLLPVDVDIFHADSLKPGHTMRGPCIIERPQDTVVVPAWAEASVDETENIILAIGRR
jgi:N-methylhydantoinase A